MIFINSNLKINSFGGTHDKEIGGMIMGFPAGFEIDLDGVQSLLGRRRPGQSNLVSARKEEDLPILKEGFAAKDGKLFTTGDPIIVAFENKDVKDAQSDEDYIPRPGHGDATYYFSTGHFLKGATSARQTVITTFAGALCKEFLAAKGIFVNARLVYPDEKEIEEAKAKGDSVGGIVEGNILGLPAGFGNPFAEKIESTLGAALFNIPGVKGVDFGLGAASANMRGSEYNDEFMLADDGGVRTITNNCGGLLGGMATGSPVVFHVYFKPTPSISIPKQSVNLKTKETVTVKKETRNDPCIALRGAAVVEAAAAIAVMDIYLRDAARNSDRHEESCGGCEFFSEE